MPREGPDVDFEDLTAYLDSVLDARVADISVLSDSLNLVLGVSTDASGFSYVLRRPTKLRDTELFTDLRVEYEILDGLEPTPVPAPEPVHYSEDFTVLGEPFYVMTALDGAGIHWGEPLPDRFHTPAQRRDIGEVLVDGLGEIHTLSTEPFADICATQSPAEQVEHAQARLATICDVIDRDFPRLRQVGEWLQRNAPATDRTRLVHGDYKPDNVFFGESETPRLTGVVDWETAMLGDPLIELGYLLLLWRDGTAATKDLKNLRTEAPTPAVRTYLADVQAAGFWPFTLAEETLTRREIVERYETATDFTYTNDRFYQAFSAYMLGVVWSDLYRYDVHSGENREEPAYVSGIAMIADDLIHGPPRI